MDLRNHLEIHVAEGGYIVNWFAAHEAERTSEDTIVVAGSQVVSVVTSVDEVCSLVRRSLLPLCGDASFDPPQNEDGTYTVPTA